jgi:predicted transcriptional regulator
MDRDDSRSALPVIAVASKLQRESCRNSTVTAGEEAEKQRPNGLAADLLSRAA